MPLIIASLDILHKNNYNGVHSAKAYALDRIFNFSNVLGASFLALIAYHHFGNTDKPAPTSKKDAVLKKPPVKPAEDFRGAQQDDNPAASKISRNEKEQIVYAGQKGSYILSDSLYALIQEESKKARLPENLVLAIVARESSFREGAFNKKSGACGLIQFLPPTLYEATYKYAAKIGRPDATALVVRESVTDKKGKFIRYDYSAASEDAAQTLKELCFDAAFNLPLGLQYKMEVAATLQNNLHFLRPAGNDYYPLKPHELYLGLYAGPGGAEKIIRDAYIERDNFGIDLRFSRAARANKTNQAVIYDPDGQSYTAAAFLKKMEAEIGAGTTPLPDFREGLKYSSPRPRAIEDLLRP